MLLTVFMGGNLKVRLKMTSGPHRVSILFNGLKSSDTIPSACITDSQLTEEGFYINYTYRHL